MRSTLLSRVSHLRRGAKSSFFPKMSKPGFPKNPSILLMSEIRKWNSFVKSGIIPYFIENSWVNQFSSTFAQRFLPLGWNYRKQTNPLNKKRQKKNPLKNTHFLANQVRIWTETVWCTSLQLTSPTSNFGAKFSFVEPVKVKLHLRSSRATYKGSTAKKPYNKTATSEALW